MTFEPFIVALLYLATYLSFARLLRHPRNWNSPDLWDILATAALAVVTLIFVSASRSGMDLVSLLASASFLIALFGIIAAPSIAFRPASKPVEFLARHGEYAGLAMLVPVILIGFGIANTRLSALMVTAMVVELAWWLGNLWANRRRSSYPLTGYDLSILNRQAHGDLEGFAKRHGIRELLMSKGVVSWQGCTKLTRPCPFNLYVNRLGLNTAPCCREYMQDLCYVVTSWLREMGAVHWIEGGTLLGAVRGEGALLPWEDDVDVSVLVDGNVTWASLASELAVRGAREGFSVDSYENHGLVTICYDPPGHWPFSWQRSRMRGEIRVDLAVYRRAISYGKAVVERRTYKGEIPKSESGWYGIPQDLVLPTATVPFLGSDFPCPRRPRKYLRVLYGDFDKVEYSYVDAAAARHRHQIDALDQAKTPQEIVA